MNAHDLLYIVYMLFIHFTARHIHLKMDQKSEIKVVLIQE